MKMEEPFDYAAFEQESKDKSKQGSPFTLAK